MARAVPIPAPLKGMNTIDPFTEDLGFARELSDFQIYQGRLSPRPARDTVIASSYVGQINWFDPTSGPVWWSIANDGTLVRLDTGVTAPFIGACQNNAINVAYNGSVLLFGCQAPRSPFYPFTAWTFTTAAITATAITCGVGWKGRLYVTDGSSIEYGNLGAIGSSTLNGGVPISYNMGGQTAIRMLTMTASAQSNTLTDSLFVIFGSGGRVLMYSGTDPTDWVQIGQWDMPAPISNIGFVEVDGDIFVATENYAYWARDLLTSGAAGAYQSSPSLPIENLWQSVGWSGLVSNALVSHAYYLRQVDDIPLDVICVQCTDQNTTAAELNKIAETNACIFAYFRKYQAWAIWFTTTPAPIAIISDVAYCTGSGTNASIFDIEYLDDNNIQPTWSTPYLLPFPGKNQSLVGARPFFQNESDPAVITVGGIADYSDLLSPFGFQAKSTAASPVTPGLAAITTVSMPVNSYQQYHPLAAIGVNGAAVSVYSRFSTISANALKNQIYKIIAYFEDGGDLY